MLRFEYFLALLCFNVGWISHGRPIIDGEKFDKALPWVADSLDGWMDNPWNSWTFDPWDSWTSDLDPTAFPWDRWTLDPNERDIRITDVPAGRTFDPDKFVFNSTFKLDPWERRTFDQWDRRTSNSDDAEQTFDPSEIWTLPPYVFTYDPWAKTPGKRRTFDLDWPTIEAPDWWTIEPPDWWTSDDWKWFTFPTMTPPRLDNDFPYGIFIASFVIFFLLLLASVCWWTKHGCRVQRIAVALPYVVHPPPATSGVVHPPPGSRFTAVTSIYVSSGAPEGGDGAVPANLDRPPEYAAVVGAAVGRNFPEVHSKKIPDSPPPSYEDHTPMRC